MDLMQTSPSMKNSKMNCECKDKNGAVVQKVELGYKCVQIKFRK
jgi:hypothetical protein